MIGSNPLAATLVAEDEGDAYAWRPALPSYLLSLTCVVAVGVGVAATDWRYDGTWLNEAAVLLAALCAAGILVARSGGVLLGNALQAMALLIANCVIASNASLFLAAYARPYADASLAKIDQTILGFDWLATMRVVQH